jgi:quercetin dioxygenase-like cupin family protein
MSRRMQWALAVFLVTTAASVMAALATPASGFRGSTLAVGRIGSFDVFNHSAPTPEEAAGQLGRPGKGPWLSSQRVIGASDVYIQSNVWDPGGTTGWHSHPGHSLITVTEGTVTIYEGDDPSCTPHEYTQGMTFVDEGGEHSHVIRNETAFEARTMAVQVIPAGAGRRDDRPANLNCPF